MSEHVISTGLGLLADAAAAQGALVTRVDWAPPLAGSDQDLVTVLADPRRAAANAHGHRRIEVMGPPELRAVTHGDGGSKPRNYACCVFRVNDGSRDGLPRTD